jgi:peptide deformylase
MCKEIEIESDDFLAIVLQHEIDHLKGKLFIDYLFIAPETESGVKESKKCLPQLKLSNKSLIGSLDQ